MPRWLMLGSDNVSVWHGTGTSYYPIDAFLYPGLNEVETQLLIRDSYTWSNLYCRIKTNTRDAASTLISRINGGDGNQTITIGAGATGTFEDTTNSDAIVSGDLINSELTVAAGTGNLYLLIVSAILYAPINNTPILSVCGERFFMNGAATSYIKVLGCIDTKESAEADAQYTFRTYSRLTNFALYSDRNDTTGDTTVRVRINAGNVNQVLTMGGGATGWFEDAANTDVITPGDELSYMITTTTGGVLFGRRMQLKSFSLARQTACSEAGAAFPAQTRYWAVGGKAWNSATELDTQATARCNFIAANMLVLVETNTLDVTSVFHLRISGADGNLAVSVGAGATGFFEDLVNTDNILKTDLINFDNDTPAGTGNLNFQYMGIEQRQLPILTSANMGNKMVGAGLI